jgi:CTP synthase
MSGVGKGISTSSIGTILQAKGYKVNIAKADPYLNVDAGTMNPTEHGEVFVLNSGLETDQDMGNYERFLNRDLSNADYMTSGMVYQSVINRERALGYKGKCVEAVPHIVDEIVNRIKEGARVSKSDITIVEVGGTIGHPDDVTFVVVSFLPIPNTLGEMKSRPTQNAIRQLQSYGVQADFIIARSEVPLDDKRKEKLAITCNIRTEHIISAPDINSIYDVPLNFERDKIGEMIEKQLKLRNRKMDMSPWKGFVRSVEKSKLQKKVLKIAVVGKYFDTGDFVLSDAYVSVIEAVKFSAFKIGAHVMLEWINAKDFEKSPAETKKALLRLKDVNGILVPGGFGETGIEGKMEVIRYARENKIPYFGLCYGMQLLVIEYARHAAGLEGAHTTEINPRAAHLVIDIMDHQKKHLEEGRYGASMRLGAYPCALKPKTIADAAYKAAGWCTPPKASVKVESNCLVTERHRHRYEVAAKYIQPLMDAGLIFSGTSPDGKLMEIAELPRSVHPFFLGTQFHPEFLARPLNPHPLFTEFLKASAKR